MSRGLKKNIKFDCHYEKGVCITQVSIDFLVKPRESLGLVNGF